MLRVNGYVIISPSFTGVYIKIKRSIMILLNIFFFFVQLYSEEKNKILSKKKKKQYARNCRNKRKVFIFLLFFKRP